MKIKINILGIILKIREYKRKRLARRPKMGGPANLETYGAGSTEVSTASTDQVDDKVSSDHVGE